MAGPQKEIKATRVKTAEKKGSLRKKESTKRCSGERRVTESPRSANAIKKDKPGETKVGKQGPVGDKEPEGTNVEENQACLKAQNDENKDESRTTTTTDAKVKGVKAAVAEANSKLSIEQGNAGDNTDDVATLAKVAPNKIKPVGSGKGTRKTGNVNQKQKAPGPTEKSKAQIPRTDTQKTADPKTRTTGDVTQRSAHGQKTTRSGSGTPKPGAAQQKTGGRLQKEATGPKKLGAETKKGATPRGPKFTPVSGKSTPQSAKRMETPTTAVGRMSTLETPPGNTMKPEESEKVSSETSVAENEEDRHASKVSVASSKVSDMSLKLDMSSSSCGLPSFTESVVGVHTPQSSATGSVSDPGYCKVPGIDITLSSNQNIKTSEKNEADDNVLTENAAEEADVDEQKQDSGGDTVEHCENSVGDAVESSDKVDERAPDEAQVNKLDNDKVETDTKDIAKVENDQVNANVNSTANTNISDDLKTDTSNSAKQVIAVSDAKGKLLVDGDIPASKPDKPVIVVPAHVLVPSGAKDETVIREGKETKEEAVNKEEKEGKGKEIRVVKEAKSKEAKAKKEPEVKDSKPKNSKESDVKDPKLKDLKDKDVKIVSKKNSVNDLKTEVQEIKTPREKSWKNLFSRNSGKEAPGKAEKAKKKDSNKKYDKGRKKDTANSGKSSLGKGESAWNRISTKDILAGVHNDNMAGEGKQNGVAMTNNSEQCRKESMSVLTVPTNLEDRQGKPDAKSLRSTGSRRLSVTSARRGSMESRRSVDIRGGLLSAIVINPPGEDKPKSLVVSDESYIQSAIPILPLPVSIMLFLLNILIPGFGTVMSGFAIFCCGKPRVNSKSGDSKTTTFCVNIWVGMAQLFTVTFCLVGWAWSIGWGIRMIGHSIQHRQEMKELREKTLQTMALSAFTGSPVRRMMGFAS